MKQENRKIKGRMKNEKVKKECRKKKERRRKEMKKCFNLFKKIASLTV